jgi:hypothetical protein
MNVKQSTTWKDVCRSEGGIIDKAEEELGLGSAERKRKRGRRLDDPLSESNDRPGDGKREKGNRACENKMFQNCHKKVLDMSATVD